MALGWLGGMLLLFLFHSAANSLTLDETKNGFPPGATWSASDSWASNATGLIAAIVAITTILTSKVDAFFDSNAALTAALVVGIGIVLTTLAPVIYTSKQAYLPTNSPGGASERLAGTWGGLLMASGTTLAGLVGTLGSLGALTFYSDSISNTAGFVVCIALFLVIVVLMTYANRTVGWIVDDAARDVGAPANPTGAIRMLVNPANPTGPPIRRMLML